LIEKEIFTINDSETILKIANLNRSIGRTELNDTSSRSHAVLTIKLLRKYNEEIIDKKKFPCVKL
jgi:hypothetical protein